MLLRKKCNCCHKPITTKTVTNIGRNEMGLWLNCQCGTTIFLKQPDSKLKMLSELLKALPAFEAYRQNMKRGA